MQKYDDLNQKDHEKHLRELIGHIKEEVEAVQKEFREEAKAPEPQSPTQPKKLRMKSPVK